MAQEQIYMHTVYMNNKNYIDILVSCISNIKYVIINNSTLSLNFFVIQGVHKVLGILNRFLR